MTFLNQTNNQNQKTNNMSGDFASELRSKRKGRERFYSEQSSESSLTKEVDGGYKAAVKDLSSSEQLWLENLITRNSHKITEGLSALGADETTQVHSDDLVVMQGSAGKSDPKDKGKEDNPSFRLSNGFGYCDSVTTNNMPSCDVSYSDDHSPTPNSEKFRNSDRPNIPDFWKEDVSTPGGSSSKRKPSVDPLFNSSDDFSSDFLDDLTTKGGMGDFLRNAGSGAASFITDAFSQVFKWLVGGMQISKTIIKEFIVSLMKPVFNSLSLELITGAAHGVIDWFDKHVDIITDIFLVVIRMINRISSGYPQDILMIEFKHEVLTVIFAIFKWDNFSLFNSDWAQSFTHQWVMPVSALFATLLALFSKTAVNAMNFAGIWRASTSMAQYLSGIATLPEMEIASLLSYDSSVAFPRTIAFHAWLERYSLEKDVPATARRKGISLYHGYLEERKEWARLDLVTSFQVKYPLLFKDHSSLIGSFPKMRMQPPCMVLEGAPGHGKTYLMNALQNFMYDLMRNFNIVESDLEYRDFSYSWTPGKKHFDGYYSQPCFILNDFGQVRESASDAEASSTEFMHIVDSNPYMPAMASLADKGVCISPMCVLVSTMIGWDQWQSHYQKCSDVSAMRRRVTSVYRVEARKWDSDRSQMAPDPEFATDDQWVFTNCRNKRQVTIQQICQHFAAEFLGSVRKYRSTYDTQGKMTTPTLDAVLDNLQVDSYWEAEKKKAPSTSPSKTSSELPRLHEVVLDSPDVQWWKGPQGVVTKLLVQLESSVYKHGSLLKAFLGAGIVLGFVAAFIHKTSVVRWVSQTSTSASDCVTNVLSTVSGLPNQASQYCKDQGWIKDPAVPNMLIGGKPHTKHKALVDGKWIGCFLEDTVTMQGVSIEKLLSAQTKKRMTGRTFQNFSPETAFVSCLNADGDAHSVYGVVLDTQHLLVPRHYRVTRTSFKFVTSGMKLTYLVRPEDYDFIDFEDLDMSLIRLFNVTISRGKKLWHRFTKVPSLLPSQQIQRVSPRGKSLGKVRTTSLTKSYEWVTDVTCSTVEMPGVSGDCGSLYLDNHGDIVGFHVAGNTSQTRSYMATLSYGRLTKAMARLADVAPPVNLEGGDVQPQMDESGCVLEEAGIEVTGADLGPYSPINRRSHLVRTGIKSVLPDTYEVAPLGFVYTENGRIPVELYRFRKWVLKQGANLIGTWSPDDSVIQSMADKLSTQRCDSLIPWETLAETNGDVPSITRGTSAGPWFPGQSKGAFCEDTETPTLKPECIEFLKELERGLEQGIGFATVSGLNLKVERLPAEKVAEGKTRLFQPADVCKYLLDRRYFGNIVACLHERLRADTGVMYAATPHEIGNKVSQFASQVKVIDVASQDNSHTHCTTIILMKLFIFSGLIDNVGGDLFCHPDLPLLTRVNRTRYILLRDTGFGQRTYHNKVFDNCSGALASGSFWTTLFNCCAGWYCLETYSLKCEPITYVLFGDDAMISCNADAAKLRRVYQSCGFDITGSGERQRIVDENIEDAVFCGRKFDPITKRMNLTHDRLGKVIYFTSVLDTEVTFTSSMINFFSELAWYPQMRYTQALESIKLNNVPLYPYIPLDACLVENVRAHKFWSSKSSLDDDSTNAEYMSMCVSVWMEASHFLDTVEDSMHPVVEECTDAIEMQMDEETDLVDSPPDPPISDETADDMISIVSTDAQDTSGFSPNEKESQYSFAPGEVSQYWSRPVRISTVEWTVAHSTGYELTSFVAFSDIIDAASNYQLKLSNTVGIKGTLRVFCVVNANPFQAGALALAASPGANVPSNICSLMSGPHSVITAGANQTASLDLPYNRETLFSVSNSYGTDDAPSYFDWVKVHLRVLSPLVTGSGSNFVNVQILVQLIDVEAMQGSITRFTMSPQMKHSWAPTQNTVDRIAATTGTVVRTVGNVLMTVSKVVALGAMLFSKSTTVAQTEPVSIQTAHSIANYNGVDESKKATINASACTLAHPNLYPDPQEGLPTLVKNIARRPGLLAFLQYSSETAVDTIIWQTPVQPLQFCPVTGTTGVGSPCGHLSAHFAYWRGTQTFRFTLIKTAYHTGSLEILVDYAPSVWSETAPTTPSRIVNLHRCYWDITSQSTVTVSVPYRRPQHWSLMGDQDYCPVIYLKAVQPLIVNPNVSSSIAILVEHWSPDLQVAWPQRIMNITGEAQRKITVPDSSPTPEPPVRCSETTQVRKSRTNKTTRRIVGAGPPGMRPQMMSALSSISQSSQASGKQGNFDPAIISHEIADHVILGSSVPDPQPEEFAYRYIAGEEVTDITQVLKRFQDMSKEAVAFGPTALYNPNVVFKPQDYAFGAWPFYFESLASMFVYGTGGYRLKFLPHPDGHELVQSRVTLPLDWDSGNISPGTPFLFQNSTDNPIMELEVSNATSWFYYRLGMVGGETGDLGYLNRPPFDVLYDNPNVPKSTLLFAFDDTVTWGGKNYLPVVSCETSGFQIRPPALPV